METNILFKNICHEIMRECHNKQIKIKRNFISYYVKLLLIDPKWNISLESEEINRLDLQAIVKFVITNVTNEFNPALITLEIQQLFNSSFDAQPNVVLKHRNNLLEKLLPLKKEILAARSTSDDDLENLYKKIVMYITLASGLGNPMKETVYNEARLALYSIFWMSELKSFINSESKEYELRTLISLVMGIRLFNRDSKKSGHGIEDVPTLLTEALEVTSHELDKGLKYTMDNVNTLTTVLDLCYQMDNSGTKPVLICVLPPDITQDNIEYAKDLLVSFRQYEIYIRKIKTELEEVNDKISYFCNEYQICLSDTHKAVQYKMAVPATLMYPLFGRISAAWCKMQDQIIYLSQLHQLLVNMQSYMKQLIVNNDVLKQIIGDRPILADADRLEHTSKYRATQLNCNTTLLKPSSIKDFYETPPEYLGFCTWKLVKSHGAMIPGNPTMGVAKYLNRYYVFSCVEGALAFEKAPHRYVYQALDIARRKPELINFLHLYDQLELVKTVSQLVIKTRDLVVTHNIEVQTVLHPVPKKIDFNYKWNVWDLKRQAIYLANISTLVTHSTQTEASGCRSAVRLQTEEMEDKICQTKRDNYSNVPTQSNFIYGLRGRKDDKQFIIELTRPVDEDKDEQIN